jgi:hypothetical protein
MAGRRSEDSIVSSPLKAATGDSIRIVKAQGKNKAGEDGRPSLMKAVDAARPESYNPAVATI